MAGTDLSRRSTPRGREDPGPELEPETALPLGAQREPHGIGLSLIGMRVAPVMFDLPFTFMEHHEVLVFGPWIALHGPSPGPVIYQETS